MPIYRIITTVTETFRGEIEVEAESPEQAKAIAIADDIFDENPDHIRTTTEYGPITEVVYCKEEATSANRSQDS